MKPTFLVALLFAVASAAPAAQAGADLCMNLVTDKRARAASPLPKPAKGVAFKDPQFGTRLIRITDVEKDFGSMVAKPLYSTVPAWNADESRLMIYVTRPSRGHALLDGKTYELIKMLNVAPAGFEQVYWDAVDPDVLWYVYVKEMSGTSLRQLIRYEVPTAKKSVAYSFPRAGKPRAFNVDNGNDPQYPSWDMKLWGFRIEMPGDRHETFSFALAEKKEGERVEGERGTPQACASGKCMWAPGRHSSRLLDPVTYDTIRQLNSKGIEHGNLGMNAAGEDFLASVQYDTDPAATLMVENLQTGKIKALISEDNGYPYPPTSTHVSAIAFKNPGWVAVSVVGNPDRNELLDQELLLANVDSGKVCRVAHHRSHGKEGPRKYWAEPHVTISPSGTRLLFASDWGGTEHVDVYVAELPAYAQPAKVTSAATAR